MYWTTQIYSGQFYKIGCIKGDVLCDYKVNEHVLHSILDPLAYKKLVYFRTRKQIQNGNLSGHYNNILFCPNEKCFNPVFIQNKSYTTHGFIECGKCNSTFCMFCENIMRLGDDTKDSETLVERIDVLECNFVSMEDEQELNALHKCGVLKKRNERVKRRVRNRKDVKEWMNKVWIKIRTKECPQCGVRIEKNSGCLHMNCLCCDVHFCWRCKKILYREGMNRGNESEQYYDIVIDKSVDFEETNEDVRFVKRGRVSSWMRRMKRKNALYEECECEDRFLVLAYVGIGVVCIILSPVLIPIGIVSILVGGACTLVAISVLNLRDSDSDDDYN